MDFWAEGERAAEGDLYWRNQDLAKPLSDSHGHVWKSTSIGLPIMQRFFTQFATVTTEACCSGTPLMI